MNVFGIDLAAPTSLFSYIALFVGMMLVFEGVRAFLTRNESVNEARNRRMRMIKKGASTEDVLELLRDASLLEDGLKGGPIARLRRLLNQSGLRIGVGLFMLIMAALASTAFFVALRYVAPWWAAGASVAFGVLVPIVIVSVVRSERAKKLDLQLPEALDLMARGLRVGHPINATITTVAEDMPDPIGSEFGIIQDQVSFGDEIPIAFREFADRVNSEDARYLAVSVGIQHGTGGNLARVLEILSKIIRDRHMMKKKIKAVSSEGRLSALILTTLPFGIFFSVHSSTPTYYGEVADDPMFRPFVIAIVTLVIVQGLILRRLVSFKF